MVRGLSLAVAGFPRDASIGAQDAIKVAPSTDWKVVGPPLSLEPSSDACLVGAVGTTNEQKKD